MGDNKTFHIVSLGVFFCVRVCVFMNAGDVRVLRASLHRLVLN
jgi:hypothetical protein